MNLLRSYAFVLVGASIVGGFALGACTGSDGLKGETGLAGPTGAQGPQGLPGPQGPAGSGGGDASVGFDAGNAFTGACTKPCHTFNGVVDQWRFSNHSHPQENEIGGGSCGNCHALDGLQQRVANKSVLNPADSGAPTDVPKGHINYRASNGSVSEIGYAGASTIGRIHCTTCHEFNPQTDPHVTGSYAVRQAPIRVPGGVNDTALIEKTADGGAQPVGQSVSYRTGNICVYCHKSRKDTAFYITASNSLSYRWGPHNGPQADVYSGKGGYHFPGQVYGTSAHASIPNACVDCHMQPVAENGNVPDHTMKPALTFCKSCHTTYTGTNYDVQGGRTIVRGLLLELQAALNAAGMLTRSEVAPFPSLDADDLTDAQFQLDKARSPGAAVNADRAGALYNYLIIARSKDLGVHNPTYAKQLIFDSIVNLTGNPPVTLPTRPQ